MKRLILAALALAAMPAVHAQEAYPLLRVYIDTPYFYDFVVSAEQLGADGSSALVTLRADGKEVGEATYELDCATGTFAEMEELTPWSGNAAAYVSAAMQSYRDLNCAAAVQG